MSMKERIDNARAVYDVVVGVWLLFCDCVLSMEFQSGQNCVTEIKGMLCANYIKTLCYIENIETSCAKYTSKCRNVMLKMQKRYAQNAETLCSKCGNVMLIMQKRYAQNAETLCSKCRNVMLKMRKCYAQNAETLCSKCTNLVMLKMQKRYAQNAQI